MIVRHAGRLPMRVLGLPGPGESGLPWVVGSATRAASLPGNALPLGFVGGLGDHAGGAAAVDQHQITYDGDARWVDLDKPARGLDRQLHAGLDDDLHSALDVVVRSHLFVAIV